MWPVFAASTLALAVLCFFLLHRLRASQSDRRALQQRIQELSRKKTDFVANVSHELKTPLTSIQGFAETLKHGALQDPQRASEFLDKILDHAKRLDRLIYDILELSRLEATDQHLEIREIDLDGFFKDLRDLFALKIDQKKQTLVIDNEIKSLRADPHLLEQAFSNLIANAHRYCPEGAVIELRSRQNIFEGKKVFCFEVVDNGPGISAEDLPRIFERFYRADKSRNRAFGGTGLGLAIVKHIVLSHGGRVHAMNNSTGGMCFQMIFPADGER